MFRSVFVTETVTLGKTAPVESCTIPVIVDVEVCALPLTLAPIRKQTADNKVKENRSEFVENMVMTRCAENIRSACESRVQ